MQVIQNNALRIILNVKINDRISIEELHLRLECESIEERLQKLRNKYVNQALRNRNPLVCEIFKDFYNFKGGREMVFKSLLDDIEFEQDIKDNLLDILSIAD